MPRATPEWIGKTNDTPIPPRVRLRCFELHGGRCAACGRRLEPGHWDVDHVIPLIKGGRHAETNLQPLCKVPCHQDKTAQDVAVKSTTYKKHLKQIGIKKATRRPLIGTVASGWKRRMDGTLVRR